MWKGIDCRETIKLEPTKANIQYAERMRAEILRRIELGTFDYKEYFPKSKRANIGKVYVPKFEDAAKTWLKIKFAELEYSSYITYKKYLDKCWLPKFTGRRIDTITMSEINETLAELDVSPKTRNNTLTPMRGIIEAAFYDGVINTNTTERIKNIKAQKAEPDPFELDEVNLIVAELLKKYNEQVANYFEFAFFTGLRTSEIIELKWSDVEAETFTVRRARVESRAKGTKTQKVRHVELNIRAKEALQRQRKHTELMKNHVFHNPNTGMQWNDHRAQSQLYWAPTLRALKLRERVPYQCRHTFATLMLMSGANPMWVAQQLGHTNMKMLLEVYAKWIARADKSREVSRVNSALIGTDLVQIKTNQS